MPTHDSFADTNAKLHAAFRSKGGALRDFFDKRKAAIDEQSKKIKDELERFAKEAEGDSDGE